MTTAQTYHADDAQQVPERIEAVPAENLMETDADRAEPYADPQALDAELPESGLHPTSPEADHAGNEDPAPDPISAEAPAAHGPVTSASESPDSPSQSDGGAEEPAMADVSPSLISTAVTMPETATNSHAAGNTASADGPWNEVQAMFVDDPRASIERAAGLVDDRVEQLIQSLRGQQHSMQSAWQANYAGTEELRVALQHYRTFWNSLEDLPAPA
jgi:hypothetical protein